LSELTHSLIHRGPRGARVGHRGVAFGFGDEPLFVDLAGPFRLTLRVFRRHRESRDIGARRRDVCFGGHHRRAEQRRIDLGDEFALLHRRIEIGVQRLDAARHLTTDIDGDHRLQAARGADTRDDIAALGGDGLVFDGVAAADLPSIEKKRCDDDDCGKPKQACAGKLFEQVRIRSDWRALRVPV
jgi:hypothetical protein